MMLGGLTLRREEDTKRAGPILTEMSSLQIIEEKIEHKGGLEAESDPEGERDALEWVQEDKSKDRETDKLSYRADLRGERSQDEWADKGTDMPIYRADWPGEKSPDK